MEPTCLENYSEHVFFFIKCMVLDTYALLLATCIQSINLVLTESRSGDATLSDKVCQ
jgi:hypothetical protein